MLTTNDVRPVLAAIRSAGVRIDPAFPGECRQLFGNPGVRAQFCRKAGLTVDEVAELLWDRGFTSERLGTVETLDLLETLFRPAPKVTKEHGRRAKPRQVLDAAVTKARRNRVRRFGCPECQQRAYGSQNALIDCGLCRELRGRIVTMVRLDPTAEEVLSDLAGAVS